MRITSEAPVAEPQPYLARPASGAAVELRGVAQSFGGLRVIERLEIGVEPRGVLGIVGPSGCGKSTLLELIAGLREPDRGSIEVAGGRSARERLGRCAYMPQRDLLFPWLRAIDNAALALRNRGLGRREARRKAHPLFERFGLAGFEESRAHELSGGMRQRIAFLRTLLAEKPVLLLDEPFAGLDAITRAEMQEWLAGALAAEPRTVVLVSHDTEEALYLCDRVVVLSARPALAVAELSAGVARSLPRSETITEAGFVAARERALIALREGSR